MGVLGWWRSLRDRRPALAEVATGAGAGLLVLLVAAWQWGATADALLRGLTIGTWLGVVVWLVARRRRVAEARAAARQAAQRLELARELHDTVAGRVAAIGVQAAAARRVIAAQPDEAEAALARIEETSRAANADLRRMLDTMRAGDPVPAAGAPGLAALPALAAAEARTMGRTGAITVHLDPAALRLADAALDRTACRIAEEAVRNSRRHAGPVPVAVDVRIVSGTLVVLVENGRGRASGDWPEGGLGIAGMRERAVLFGGTLDAGRTAGGGFRVEARLPLSVVDAAADSDAIDAAAVARVPAEAEAAARREPAGGVATP